MLTCSDSCLIINATDDSNFLKTDKKLYLQVISLSPKNNTSQYKNNCKVYKYKNSSTNKI